MSAIDVTECPDCSQKGTYEARILIGGRGVYTCPDGHRWQNADEKPSTKGVPLKTNGAGSCPHDPSGTSPYACACEDG